MQLTSAESVERSLSEMQHIFFHSYHHFRLEVIQKSRREFRGSLNQERRVVEYTFTAEVVRKDLVYTLVVGVRGGGGGGGKWTRTLTEQQFVSLGLSLLEDEPNTHRLSEGVPMAYLLKHHILSRVKVAESEGLGGRGGGGVALTRRPNSVLRGVRVEMWGREYELFVEHCRMRRFFGAGGLLFENCIWTRE